MNKVIGLTSIVIILAVTSMIGTPVLMANKHHNHLTDTQREDSTASDAQGNTCNFGRHHDQCRDQFLASKEGGNILPPGPGKHFGECEDGDADHPLGTKCDIEDN